MVVGLTGGIACGKTTVAEILRSFGAEVINADSVGHEVLRDDPVVYRKIVSTFGKGILSENGDIDRSKLGRIVFDNPDYLDSLNEIVHPPVIERVKAEIQQKLSSGKCKIVVVEIVLLIECNLMDTVDSIVLVYADEDVQISRLIQRGLSVEDARKRIRSQMSSDEKARFADFIIYNSGSLSNTTMQVKMVWEALNSIAYMEDI